MRCDSKRYVAFRPSFYSVRCFLNHKFVEQRIVSYPGSKKYRTFTRRASLKRGQSRFLNNNSPLWFCRLSQGKEIILEQLPLILQVLIFASQRFNHGRIQLWNTTLPTHFQTKMRLKRLTRKITQLFGKSSLKSLSLYSRWLITFTYDFEHYEQVELGRREKHHVLKWSFIGARTVSMYASISIINTSCLMNISNEYSISISSSVTKR